MSESVDLLSYYCDFITFHRAYVKDNHDDANQKIFPGWHGAIVSSLTWFFVARKNRQLRIDKLQTLCCCLLRFLAQNNKLHQRETSFFTLNIGALFWRDKLLISLSMNVSNFYTVRYSAPKACNGARAHAWDWKTELNTMLAECWLTWTEEKASSFFLQCFAFFSASLRALLLLCVVLNFPAELNFAFFYTVYCSLRASQHWMASHILTNVYGSSVKIVAILGKIA